ncbi:MAG: FAD-binding protein [Deltaproteobacteria bacterium]|nr:FAD-binding protein [Deltaproteobacteria bacterium]MCL5791757.1 FAD-binding protein [Deltaproteobacteria bacterium]
MDYDIVVIGSGISGVMAGINAAKTKKVAIIRKGYGATALSSGAFDIAGAISKRGRPFKNSMNLPSEIEGILNNKPHHPYSLIAKEFLPDPFNGFMTLIKNVIMELCSMLNENGVEYNGSWDNNMVLPVQHGTFKITSFSQSSMSSGNLIKLMGRKILFIGFESTSIHSKIRFEFLKDTLSRYGLLSFKDINYINIDLKALGIMWDGHDFIALAREMDNLDNAKKVISDMRGKVSPTGFDYIFVPPIMGIENHKQILKLFRDAFGDTISEFLSVLPSAPGLRLQYALDKLLKRFGITLLEGDAFFNGTGDTVKRLDLLLKDGTKTSVSANSFVLSTGKFVTQGIKKTSMWEESIFGLPVFIDAMRVTEPFPLKYLTDDPYDEQILFSMGVKVDDDFRPIDEYEKIIYKNLFASGAVLSGYNYIYDRTGMGTAIITGAKAGLLSTG